MNDPILVTGIPRSRTSLTMDILHRSGMFVGNICGATKANPNGQFECVEIVNSIEKPYLKKIGADPKLQHPLPTYEDLEPDNDRRERVLHIMRKSGLKNQPWGFKICKGIGDWPIWNEAFPNATWVFVRRGRNKIIESVKKTSFMNNRKDWEPWVDYHLEKIEDMKKEVNWYEIWTDKFLEGDFSDLWFLPEIGLELTENAKNAVDISITKK